MGRYPFRPVDPAGGVTWCSDMAYVGLLYVYMSVEIS